MQLCKKTTRTQIRSEIQASTISFRMGLLLNSIPRPVVFYTKREENSQIHKGILQNKLLPSMESHRTTIFQQDNTLCHSSKVMQAFFTKNKLTILDWPGNRSNLSPIENLWIIMKSKMRRKEPENIEDYQRKLIEVWTNEITEFCEETSSQHATSHCSCIKESWLSQPIS